MTYSQDSQRGHDHLDSVRDRRARIAAYAVDRQKRTDDFDAALLLLRRSLRTVDQTLDLLHCAATTLAYAPTDSTISQLIDGIDRLADKVQFPESEE